MNSTSPPIKRNITMVAKQLLISLLIANAIGFLLSFGWTTSTLGLLLRVSLIALIALITFTLLDYWPSKLPKWLARWVTQVIGVAISVPVTVFVIYWVSTDSSAPPFWQDADRLLGFNTLTFVGLLVAPWIALTALVRQKDALARHQALAFQLERSKLQQQFTEARHRLLQAQVAPHFLFNTLANIQALVNSGSSRAGEVLNSLTAYLRAAVPQLDESTNSFNQELKLTSAYLELMQLRMPDRLTYDLSIDKSVYSLACPAMTLMTLVENAIRHGIDPSEKGGHVQININLNNDQVVIQVIDTGVGLQYKRNENSSTHSTNDGTGLSSLRERLKLSFNNNAHLQVFEQQPHGVHAEVIIPTQEAQVL